MYESGEGLQESRRGRRKAQQEQRQETPATTLSGTGQGQGDRIDERECRGDPGRLEDQRTSKFFSRRER